MSFQEANLTAYTDRLRKGFYEPKATPAQPGDVKFTDPKFLEKTGGGQTPAAAPAPASAAEKAKS